MATVLKLINEWDDEDVLNRLKLLELQFQNRMPELDCGLFLINWKLGFLVIMVTSNYVFNNIMNSLLDHWICYYLSCDSMSV